MALPGTPWLLTQLYGRAGTLSEVMAQRAQIPLEYCGVGQLRKPPPSDVQQNQNTEGITQSNWEEPPRGEKKREEENDQRQKDFLKGTEFYG